MNVTRDFICLVGKLSYGRPSEEQCYIILCLCDLLDQAKEDYIKVWG